jgi:hypothetical protein
VGIGCVGDGVVCEGGRDGEGGHPFVIDQSNEEVFGVWEDCRDANGREGKDVTHSMGRRQGRG